MRKSGSHEVKLYLGNTGTYLTNLYFFNITVGVTGLANDTEITLEQPIEEEEPEEEQEVEEEEAEEVAPVQFSVDTILLAKIAYWKDFLDSDSIAKELEANQPKVPVLLPGLKETIKPLSLKFSGINEESEIVIDFSTPVVNPFAISSNGRRNLLSIDQIDVQKEIMDIEFKLQSDQDPDELEYYLELTKFDSNQMKVLLNFTNPL